MHEVKKMVSQKLPKTKSHTEFSDIYNSAPLSNFLLSNLNKIYKDPSAGETVTESDRKSILKNSVLLNETPYVTSEMYHGLNKNLSKQLVRSVSTIYCDLDDIAKRHSFHCLTDISMSNVNILKVMKLPINNNNGFKGKTNAVVQECATQIHPKLFAKDSMVTNKKAKKHLQNDVLSSEIFLRDGNYGKQYRKNHYYYNIDTSDRHQKFWSFTKYRTEYTKPVLDDKKSKKKDQGKRTENPCPCQLFSYACPCTDEKSLTELAKNSKCLNLTDQITSTTKFDYDKKKKTHDLRHEKETVTEDKLTNANVSENTVQPQKEPIINAAFKSKSRKKKHLVICPNCKERVEVLSATDEEESLKLEDSSLYSKEITPAYNCSAPSKGHTYKPVNDGDMCRHDPRCDLIPVCQILPTEDVSVNSRNSKKQTSNKSIPRVIRITKACRHHPPCTVVPSCQRANVLRNNCEYIPPCLHRPRCVNLPLCVPFAKSIHYDESRKQFEDEIPGCLNASRYKYSPTNLYNSITNNADGHYNMIARVQNACEFKNEYRTSEYAVNPKSTLMPLTLSPAQMPTMSPVQMSKSPCCSCRSNKSCQFESSECFSAHTLKETASAEVVIFIRDVGCQFQAKTFSPMDSLIQSKTSSASFNLVNIKTGNYNTALHTVRCEEKCTNPISGVESLSTDSIMSLEVDSYCPSHGRRSLKNRCTGFKTSQHYVAAFAKSHKNPLFISDGHSNLSKTDAARYRDSTFPVKSRRSFLKGKYRKIFATKSRKGSKSSGNHNSNN